MKTLDQLDTKLTSLQLNMQYVKNRVDVSEPRIAIQAVPTNITSAGSYYLADNMTVTTVTNAIAVRTGDVTLDLMGFNLECTAPAPAGSCGILIDTNSNVEVRNGTIKGFGRAVAAYPGSRGNRVIGIRALENLEYGILLASPGAVVTDCNVHGPGGLQAGIRVDRQALVICNYVAGSAGSGITASNACVIARNITHSNATFGIITGNDCILSDNLATGPGHASAGIRCRNNCTLVRNTATFADDNGIHCDDACVLIGNIASTNGGVGIAASMGCTLVANTAQHNRYGGIMSDSCCTLQGNAAYENQSAGIEADVNSTVINNASGYNTGSGIYVGSECVVKNNAACDNNNNGIRVNNACVIADNVIADNNSIDSASFAGLRLSRDCMVRNNLVTDCNQYNIYCYDDNSVLEENLVTWGPDYGIYFNATGNYYISNRYSDNSTNVYNSAGQTDGGGNVAF
jgi:parallel beta-helix repeat protein